MIQFTDNNGRIDVINLHEGHMEDCFKPAIYNYKQDMTGQYLVRSMDKFDIPDKIYGDTPKRSDKIKRTFDSRDGTTGVLLTGLKGSGKTLLMKHLANKCIEDGIPVITINEPNSGADFMTFINNLGPCVLIFDEFAKNYRRNGGDQGQEALLTLFDGVASSKKLILLSENNYWDVSDLYKNRPSRIYYSYKYEKLEKSLVEEYCEANVVNKDFVPNIISMSNKTLEFSFDVLQSVIEECNRYPEDSFDSIVKDLNISVSESKTKFAITSAVAESGKYSGMKYATNMKIVPFDDFYASVSGKALEHLEGDQEGHLDSFYLEMCMDTFEEVKDDGTYVFSDGRIVVEGKIITPSFSQLTTKRSNHNSDYYRPVSVDIQKPIRLDEDIAETIF